MIGQNPEASCIMDCVDCFWAFSAKGNAMKPKAFYREVKSRFGLGGRTLKQAVAVAESRRELASELEFASRKPKFLGAEVHRIYLGGHRLDKPTSHSRAKNWEVPKATALSSFVEVEDCGTYSSRCSYHKMAYTQFIESWGVVANGCLYFVIDRGDKKIKRLLKPWRGWHFEVDQYGIKLVDGKGRRDLH